MGGFVSKVDRSAKERSDAIDRQLKEDGKQLKKEHKILLLGEYFKCPLYTFSVRRGPSLCLLLFSLSL